MSSGLGNLVPDHINGLGRLLLHPWIPPQASGQGTDLVIPFASGSRAENIRGRPHSHNQKPTHPYRSPRLVLRSTAGLPAVAFRLGLRTGAVASRHQRYLSGEPMATPSGPRQSREVAVSRVAVSR